ncbi:protein OSB2, chloroplastic-like [Actinidia eriantha]|uniref:protein OSB2, chloroplastic-like n=1 Tax=Actinidia eriantha TaxID=165200 RepID=UPI002587FCE0|nr:protein OSB2, chloroplastic-like [Actinidia eriantha]XP_057508771.1 protein OSB2, chloroplastic-like [Actinidia eriantha]
MAAGQTLALAKNVLLCAPKTPLTTAHFPYFPPNPTPALGPKHRRSSIKLKCSVDYNNNSSSSNGRYDRAMSPQYPKPAEIQWKKELSNLVQLIGIVSIPVQIKQLSSGKFLAWSRLSVKNSSTDTVWINLTFWDELAHVAFQHVEAGQQIHVSGRLVSDRVETEEGKQQTYYRVVVQQLNFVEKNFSSVASYDGDSNGATPGRKFSNSAVNNTGSTEALWQAFFANPMDWWDNRKNKRNSKAPDFKHKDTGEALWIEGWNNPSWVKSQLAVLDAKMNSVRDQNDGSGTLVDYVAGDDYSRF